MSSLDSSGSYHAMKLSDLLALSWTVVSDDYKPSAQWEYTFAMTEHGLEILSH